ncbi:MarR family winged helix-turn-helix transcriptional regulator [Paenibacillus sp. GYB003]|uniref:MarR family winged helix-turn-helix transcriptional regulator n=1 Tax=Paenibacillus sp. GYB003 TaxID=2994392 RepID=UPI002F961113
MGTQADTDKITQCVKEMNEAEYVINTLLLHEFRNVLDDEITTKQALLLNIVQKRQAATVREIAEQMQVSSSAISQIVGKLEKSGYVRRDINVNNRREILVRLGPQGETFFAKQEDVQKAIIERFYAKMEFAELQQMRDLMLKLKAVVEAELGGG